MCLATVFKSAEPKQKILEFVSKMEVDGTTIVLTDVMGEQTVIEGVIKMVDLANSKVEINCLN